MLERIPGLLEGDTPNFIPRREDGPVNLFYLFLWIIAAPIILGGLGSAFAKG